MLDEYGPTRMIRTGSEKYVHRYPDGPNEFYDLNADPEETSNEIDNPVFRNSIDRLRAELEEWFARYTEPERDGSTQAVMGRGQLDVVGGESEAFGQDLVYLTELDQE